MCWYRCSGREADARHVPHKGAYVVGLHESVSWVRSAACDTVVVVPSPYPPSRNDGGGLGAPPLAWGASAVMLPWLGETVVSVSVVSRQEEHHVIIEAKGHELETTKPGHRAELQRVFRIGHPDP
jgi:hypothetical protein